MGLKVEFETKQILVSGLSLAIGCLIGMLGQKQYDISHTPEDQIRQLNQAASDNKASKKALSEQLTETNKALDMLKKTKTEYQNEIRPELESKIRKELEDYISKADSTYEKARHDNDMAELKLELAKQYRKTQSDRNFEEFLWRY